MSDTLVVVVHIPLSPAHPNHRFLFGHILAMSNFSFSFFLLYSELEYTDTMHVLF
jgi:hypothetical protein